MIKRSWDRISTAALMCFFLFLSIHSVLRTWNRSLMEVQRLIFSQQKGCRAAQLVGRTNQTFTEWEINLFSLWSFPARTHAGRLSRKSGRCRFRQIARCSRRLESRNPCRGVLQVRLGRAHVEGMQVGQLFIVEVHSVVVSCTVSQYNL